VGGDGKSKLLDVNGKEYTPVKAVYDGTKWVYDDVPKLTVDIKGHFYSGVDGQYIYKEFNNVQLNMETKDGQELFRIKASDLNNPSFPKDLVIWNNSGAGTSLGGIDPNNPQFAVGDKTIINVTAKQAAASTERVDFGYTFTDRYGQDMTERTTGYSFKKGFFDNNVKDLKFFTLNEEIGISYDGDITLKTGTFGASNLNPEYQSTFNYKAGLFSYVDDLCQKIQTGKQPQIGNELGGNDDRLKQLLLYRATIGARVNRLELQQSRLTSNQTSSTDLLSKTEDADTAEVIMNYKIQENVYNAALAVGAKIIPLSLVDFIR